MFPGTIAPNAAETNMRHMPMSDFNITLAEQMAANWLFKLRRMKTGGPLKYGMDTTWADMTAIEQNHYVGLLRRAEELIWEGR